MNPLTNLDFWLNLGNLFAATAIALFAIKSGYIDKKCDDMEQKHNNLCNKYNLIYVVNDALNEKKFNVIKNASVEPRDYDEYEVQSWCYENIFDHYHLWVPEVPLPKKIEDITSDVPSDEIIFFLKVFARYVREQGEFGIDKLNSLLRKLAITQKYEKQIENLYKSIYDALQGEYYHDYIKNKDNNIRLATDAYNNKLYILNKLLEYDRVFVEKELAAKKNIAENDYNHLEEIKNRFDVYISNGSILFLFATGIAILAISLVAPPIIITAVVAFSPAIIIVIRCLHLLLDEIVGEDGHKTENA